MLCIFLIAAVVPFHLPIHTSPNPPVPILRRNRTSFASMAQFDRVASSRSCGISTAFLACTGSNTASSVVSQRPLTINQRSKTRARWFHGASMRVRSRERERERERERSTFLFEVSARYEASPELIHKLTRAHIKRQREREALFKLASPNDWEGKEHLVVDGTYSEQCQRNENHQRVPLTE